LNPAELLWLEDFAGKYYEGRPNPNLVHKKEANHRRYMAKEADAMSRTECLESWDEQVDDLDPEKQFLLKEQGYPTT
jgi:hypothetical protein